MFRLSGTDADEHFYCFFPSSQLAFDNDTINRRNYALRQCDPRKWRPNKNRSGHKKVECIFWSTWLQLSFNIMCDVMIYQLK